LRKPFLLLSLTAGLIIFALTRPTAGAHPTAPASFGIGRLEERQIHVLLIGVDEYADTKFAGCANDVLDLSAKFLAEGVERENIHELINHSATLQRIKAAIDSIARIAQPNDIFVFSFSGFSTGDPKENSADSVMLMLTGGFTRARHNSAATVLPVPVLAEWLSQIPCSTQFIFSEAGSGIGFKNAMLASLFESDPWISTAAPRHRIIATTDGAGIEYRDSTGHCNGLMFHIMLHMKNITSTMRSSTSRGVFEHELYMTEFQWRSGLEQENQNMKPAYCKVYEESDYRSLFMMLRPSSRGFEEDAPADAVTSGSHRKLAVLVGTNKYENGVWQRLRNPLNDVRAIGTVLHDKFGYELDTLYNQKRDSILSEFCRLRATLDSTDEVVVVFSGHGYYNPQTSCGHIIPCDGLSPSTDQFSNSSYLHWNDLKNMIDAWRAKNVFVIVDVCFGGKFDQVSPEVVINDYRKMLSDLNPKQFHDRKAEHVSRMFLAAGSVPVPDYWSESQFHSPFANKLLNSLNACTDFETPSKLFQDMQMNVTEPVLRTFGRHDKVNGDFVLVPVAKTDR